LKNFKKNSHQLVLLSILSGLIIVTLLYFSGFISFFRRFVEASYCSILINNKCNKLTTLSLSTNLLNQELESISENSEVLFQRVVYIKLDNQNLWVWSMESLSEKYLISDNTTYGIASAISRNELNSDYYRNLLNTGTLKLVDNSNKKKESFILIEGKPGKLIKDEFLEILKTGNLVQIVYNGITKEIIGIILFDFKKI